MLVVLAAVLALAGAPSDTRVLCDPALVGGYTYYTLAPPVVLLDPIGCSGILLAGASVLERNKIKALNPNANIDYLIGDGLLLALHEASHAGLRSGDETMVECQAMRLLPGLLAKYAPNPSRSMQYAQTYDLSLGPDYHNRPCP